MTHKPPSIPNYAFQINSTIAQGSQNIRLLLLQAQAEGRDFSGMSLTDIHLESGGLSEFKDQFGNSIKRSRDKFGRFASNTGAAIKKGAERALETNKEHDARTEREFLDVQKRYASAGKNGGAIPARLQKEYDQKVSDYNNLTTKYQKAFSKDPKIQKQVAEIGQKLLNGKIKTGEAVKQIEELADKALPPTLADKTKLAIRGVPGQVKKGMDALSKAPENAIASADADYKSASKEVKSAIDATVSSGLDMVQKNKKDICAKIGATGRAAQETFGLVVKAAQKGVGIKEKVEAARQKAAEVRDSAVDELIKKAGAVGALTVAITAQVAVGVGSGVATAMGIVGGANAVATAAGVTLAPQAMIPLWVGAAVAGMAVNKVVQTKIWESFAGETVGKSVSEIERWANKLAGQVGASAFDEKNTSKVAASGYISSSADSYLDYLMYS
jgi:hypothetical protein